MQGTKTVCIACILCFTFSFLKGENHIYIRTYVFKKCRGKLVPIGNNGYPGREIR